MRLFSFAAAVLLVTQFSLAADPAPAGDKQDKGFVSLFDGKTLDGWRVIGCEIVVQDGAMLMKSGNGVIRPERTFKDFILDLEWKALKADKWDSGIYIRCKDPQAGRPWPAVWQVNLQQGQEGNIGEFKEARSKGLTKDGEWNHFVLTVKGTQCELEINGKPAWKADGLTEPAGFICLQAEVPGGGQYLFRNIRIKELEAAK